MNFAAIRLKGDANVWWDNQQSIKYKQMEFIPWEAFKEALMYNIILVISGTKNLKNLGI